MAAELKLACCREFCEWVDRCEAVDVWSWLENTRRLLGLLQAHFNLAVGGETAVLPYVPDEVKFELFQRLQLRIGEVANYWVAGDGVQTDSVPTGSVADDCADIYYEITPVLALFDAAEISAADAIQMLILGYRQHWGQHVNEAEGYLSSLMAANRFAN